MSVSFKQNNEGNQKIYEGTAHKDEIHDSMIKVEMWKQAAVVEINSFVVQSIVRTGDYTEYD